jgi:hypothetical protein
VATRAERTTRVFHAHLAEAAAVIGLMLLFVRPAVWGTRGMFGIMIATLTPCPRTHPSSGGQIQAPLTAHGR